MASSSPTSPARGTRPRNRREITVQVATELFYSHGYAQVGMSDIAEATNVGASALYRHFPSKADLLVAAVSAGLTPYADALSGLEAAELDPGSRLQNGLRSLADVAIEQRRLGVLWQRDARNLSKAEQHGLREQLGSATADLRALILAARLDLDRGQADELAWCTMGALVSISFHSLELPRPQFENLLIDIVTRIAWTSMTREIVDAPLIAAPDAAADSRRDILITAATELFADRGFAATGIDEIGDAAGIAGPSVYSHFESKQAILAAAIQRASDILKEDADAVLTGGGDPATKLAKLVDSYVDRANRDRFVIRTLVSEMDQLSAADRDRARREQRDYIDNWVNLLRQFTDEDAVSARIRVQAVLLVVNDAVQTPHLRARPGFEHTLARLARTVLRIETT